MNQLTSVLESLLFVASKPLTVKTLAKITGAEKKDIEASLIELAEYHASTGIVLLEANGTYQFATNNENTDAVITYLNSDLREKLTDATVEVLAIIAYRQPISKAEIEAVRGVNSQYSIRHLLMRGMIDKIPNPGDARGSLYQVTTEFLQHMGLASISQLPSFEELAGQIQLPATPAAAEENPIAEAEPEPQIEEQIIAVSTPDTEIIQDEVVVIPPEEIEQQIIMPEPSPESPSEDPSMEEDILDDEDDEEDDEEDED